MQLGTRSNIKKYFPIQNFEWFFFTIFPTLTFFYHDEQRFVFINLPASLPILYHKTFEFLLLFFHDNMITSPNANYSFFQR